MIGDGVYRANVSLPQSMRAFTYVIARDFEKDDGFSGFVRLCIDSYRKARVAAGRPLTPLEIEAELAKARRVHLEAMMKEIASLLNLEDENLERISDKQELERAELAQRESHARKLSDVLDLIWKRCPKPGIGRDVEMRDQAKLRSMDLMELGRAVAARERHDRLQQQNLRVHVAPQERDAS